MNEPHYTIDSYSAEFARIWGLYLPCFDVLREEIDGLIAAFEASPETLHPVPLLDDMMVSARIVGDGYHIRVEKHRDENGKTLDRPILIIETGLAVSEASAAGIARIAMDWAETAGYPTLNPGFHAHLAAGPEAPFTAILPNPHILSLIQSGLITERDLNCVTGFIQTLIGNLLLHRGFAPATGPIPASEDLTSAEDNSDAAGRIQTGGEPINTLIVKRVDGDIPEVYAFISDAELDVFKVTFDLDGTFDLTLDGLSYTKLDQGLLTLISDLAEEAGEVFDNICDILDDLEEEEEGLSPAENNSDAADPYLDLYSWHRTKIIDPELSARLQATLGIGPRYENGQPISKSDEAA